MSEETNYFCDNPKCFLHIPVKRDIFKYTMPGRGTFENHVCYKAKELKKCFKVCDICKNAVDMFNKVKYEKNNVTAISHKRTNKITKKVR